MFDGDSRTWCVAERSSSFIGRIYVSMGTMFHLFSMKAALMCRLTADSCVLHLFFCFFHIEFSYNAGTFSRFWGVWRNIFAGLYWRHGLGVFMVGSKCHAGIFLWRGPVLWKHILFDVLNFLARGTHRISSFNLCCSNRLQLFWKTIWKMLKPVWRFL